MQTPLQKKIEPFKELLNEIIAPEHRSNINIIEEHVESLKPGERKKLSQKKNKKKTTVLTRKEFAALGLYNLPKTGLKYEDFLQLHELWKQYMMEYLSLNSTDFHIPEIHDPRFDAFNKLLVKCDLHGAIITVSKSKCPSYVRQSGIVILESKNILKIIDKNNNLKSLPKKNSIFKIMLGNLELTIFGKHFAIRPAERSVKKIKNNVEIDL